MLKAREELLVLLRRGARGEAQRQGPRVRELILELERTSPVDLATPGALELLEGVWELRWSSSKAPYLRVAPWIDNLQVLVPARARAMNLLRLTGAFSGLGGIAVLARIEVQGAQRVSVSFERGGWIGPGLGPMQLRLLRQVSQSFLDFIT